MSAAANISTFLDDRMNPIVVKEVRQAVRSRFVVAVLMLFLVVELFTLGVFLFMSDEWQQNFYAGRDAFMVLQGILLATCLLFVPLYVGVRLAAERLDTNADLLFITTIRPSSILWGKWLGGMLVALLIFSACAPFMVITYLLRGVDLPSISLVLGLDTLVMCVALMMAIMLACIPVSGIVKGLVGLCFLGALGFGFGLTMAGSTAMVYGGVGSAAGTWEFWGVVAAFVATGVGAMGLLFVLALAMLTPSTANRALPVRLYLLAAWLVTGGVFGALAYYLRGDELVGVWAVMWVIVLNLAILGSVSEREEWGPRVRRTIPRRILPRAVAFLFYSGSAGGLIWTLLMIAATVGGMWLVTEELFHGSSFHSRELSLMVQAMAIVTLYILAYSLIAVQIRRHLLDQVKSYGTAALAMLLAAVGSLLPPLILFMISPQSWDQQEEIYLLANPMGIFSEIDQASSRWRFWMVGGIAAGVAVLASVPWVIDQMRRFKPLEIRSAPPAEPSASADAGDELETAAVANA